MGGKLAKILFVGFNVVFMFSLVRQITDREVNLQRLLEQNFSVNSSFLNDSNVRGKKAAVDRDEIFVEKVVDGDTIIADNGDVIRYIGIDAPEINGELSDCFARESYLKNKEMVEGNYVQIEKDSSETDRYGRLLRYVFLDRGYEGGENFMINNYLVRQGYARASAYPPDVKYKLKFIEAELEARGNNLGLWKSCVS